MNSQARAPLPLLELIMLVAAAAVLDWAAFQMYHIGQDVERNRADLQTGA